MCSFSTMRNIFYRTRSIEDNPTWLPYAMNFIVACEPPSPIWKPKSQPAEYGHRPARASRSAKSPKSTASSRSTASTSRPIRACTGKLGIPVYMLFEDGPAMLLSELAALPTLVRDRQRAL